MSRRAGVISIDIVGGQAQFTADMEKAKGSIREFGREAHGSVSGVQATSGALRVLEGNMTNNLRASERFIANVLHLGPALQAAFPVVGAIAFAGILGELGKKVYNFFKSVEQAPEKLTGAFRELNAPLRLTNDELKVTSDRLEVDIAKLEGKRPNTLKLALDEARVAADKLAEALDKDLASLDKMMKENAPKWFNVFTKGTSDLQKQEFGVAGFGGFRGSVADLQGDPAKLTAAYKEHIQLLQRQLDLTDLNAKAGAHGLVDYKARTEILKEFIREYQGEVERISLTSKETGLEAKKENLEQKKQDLETVKRLREELAAAQAAQATGLARVNIEYQNELQKLAAAHELNAKTLPIVQEIYDAKRLTVYNEFLKTSDKTLEELADHWRRLGLEAHKAQSEFMSDEIKQGTKALEEQAKALQKLGEENKKLAAQMQNEGLQHQVRMIALTPGASADPVGTLIKQQALERQAIEDKYTASLKTAGEELKGAELLLEKSNIERMKRNDLDQLNIQLAEKQAEVRQKDVRDFFREMQGQAQTAGNILYDAMHSGLNRVSDEFAKLITHQKTSFGKMFESLGEEMLKSTIKSGLQRGLGELGKVFGIHAPLGKPDGSAGNPYHVIVDSAGWENPNVAVPGSKPGGWQGPLQSLAPVLPKALSGIGGLFKSLFSGGGVPSVTSDISFMAGGGDVDPGGAYIVGENEPEFFSPRTAGTVTPLSKMMGGDTHHYDIDARGAELGVEHRIRRALEAVHNSAVSTSVRANQDRARRVPQHA